MKITIAQLNPIVGDVAGNAARIEDILRKESRKTDLIVLPELYLVGYPPRDLLKSVAIKKAVARALSRLKTLSKKYPRVGILCGAPMPTRGRLHLNAAVLIHEGKIRATCAKSLLPTYDVFDEVRYFEPAEGCTVIPFKKEVLGVTVCEDMWNDNTLWPQQNYRIDPVKELVAEGATILINISASPFFVGKEKIRHRLLMNHAKKHARPFVFVNQVGANDELIFDGKSAVITRSGHIAWQGKAFAEEVHTIDTKALRAKKISVQPDIGSLHDALVLGVRDYIRKCGFSKVVLGLSGGIDSALTCAIAVAALGKENVQAVTMPSQFSSEGSVNDSLALARTLGIVCEVVPIASIYERYLEIIQPYFAGTEFGLAEENIQARIRGNILMSFSNKFGALVLSTGNKSELAVGYCTLYGDMSGGLSVISDVPKTTVYALARFINKKKTIIPKATITKAPSAELRPNQKDQDSLPEYNVLDAILYHYVECIESHEQILARGFDKKTVDWVIKAVNRSEYKRRQAAPGLKVTSKAFGVGRRIPVAAKHI